MEFIIRVEARLAGKIVKIRDIAKITRVAAGIGAEELGLTLENGKDILHHGLCRSEAKSSTDQMVSGNNGTFRRILPS